MGILSITNVFVNPNEQLGLGSSQSIRSNTAQGAALEIQVVDAMSFGV
jgi:hypothetical protein